MATFCFSERERYFLPLCGIVLLAETPPDGQIEGCSVCIEPVEETGTGTGTGTGVIGTGGTL